MDRRQAIKYISVLLGGTMAGSSSMLSGCRSGTSGSHLNFTEADVIFLDEVAETILPETSTPGAKAAGVGQFMTVMVADCYDEEDQEVFRKGMKQLNDIARSAYKNDFIRMSAAQKHELLTRLDSEQRQYQETKHKDERSHYFRMMKELTLLGYFTSEVGSKQARRYVETPGRYDGCAPYSKGEKAWA